MQVLQQSDQTIHNLFKEDLFKEDPFKEDPFKVNLYKVVQSLLNRFMLNL